MMYGDSKKDDFGIKEGDGGSFGVGMGIVTSGRDSLVFCFFLTGIRTGDGSMGIAEKGWRAPSVRREDLALLMRLTTLLLIFEILWVMSNHCRTSLSYVAIFRLWLTA